jgi:adenylate cyclase
MRFGQVRLSLHISILTIFLALVVVLAGTLTWTNYTNTRKGAAAIAEEFFDNTRQQVDQRQMSLFDPLASVVAMYASDPGLARGDTSAILEPWLNFAESYPQIYEIYVGFETGAVFEVFNFPGVSEAQASNAPSGSRFAIHTVDFDKTGGRRELWRFLDRNRAEISRETKLGTYDPRLRSWYQQAQKSAPSLIRTAPYPFATSANMGLTFAKAFPGGVVAADLTLGRMSAFLRQFIASHPRRTIFTFDEEGLLTAHGTPEAVMKKVMTEAGPKFVQATTKDLGDPVADAMVDAFRAGGTFPLKPIVVDGTAYLSMVNNLPPRYGAIEYLAFAVPLDELAGTVMDTARTSALFAAVLIMIAVPLIMWVSRRISRPLALLGEETDRIRRFELDGKFAVHSRITEVHELAQAIGNMKNVIREVSKFVPKALVQDLMASNVSLEVGGTRRFMTFLFTDVRNFTPLSETMEPEALMSQMSAYFDTLVRIILGGRGTVDKYVGDAIMAFWNAPRLQEDHEGIACEVALACREASNSMNAKWQSEDKAVWYTRFGVHNGEAVVGNVGSSDRIDYTAIGAAVNIASRLEGLNKFYGTQILVSRSIMEKTSHRFLFRAIDRALPVGAAHPMEIYELIGGLKADEPFPAGADLIRRVADWTAIYVLYQGGDWAGARTALQAFAAATPDDAVARIYMERLARINEITPPQGWDGVTRFEQK